MKNILIITILTLLAGCQSYNPQTMGNALKAFGDGYNRTRENREARELRRAQTQYYQNQNLNAWRNY